MTDLDQRLDIVSEWGRSAIGIDMIHLAKDAKAEIERLRAALQRIKDNGERGGYAYGVAFAALQSSNEQ